MMSLSFIFVIRLVETDMASSSPRERAARLGFFVL